MTSSLQHDDKPCVVRYVVGSLSDKRAPWLANDAMLRNCIDQDSSSLIKENGSYPKESYPEGTHILFGKTFSVGVKEGGEDLDLERSVLHVLEKVTIIAPKCLTIHKGCVIAAKEVILKASVVRIYDDHPNYPIRTTVLGQEHLTIIADLLSVQGADVRKPSKHTLQVQQYKFGHMTQMSAWLPKQLSSEQ